MIEHNPRRDQVRGLDHRPRTGRGAIKADRSSRSAPRRKSPNAPIPIRRRVLAKGLRMRGPCCSLCSPFPLAAQDWAFPHRPHLAMGLDCQTCHSLAPTSQAAADDLLPDGQFVRGLPQRADCSRNRHLADRATPALRAHLPVQPRIPPRSRRDSAIDCGGDRQRELLWKAWRR